MSVMKLDEWYRLSKKNNYLKIKKKHLSKLKNWSLDNLKISNKSKSFFSINFYKIYIGKNIFHTPLICQNEVGILGLIKAKINSIDKYLLQAKIEPGNVNKIQISPTVQATKSNYTRKHKGKITNYIEYFTKKNNYKILTKIKQSEQGTRYKNKYNNNILIEVNDYKKIKIKSNFKWFSKLDILNFLKKNNLINMDTLSIFSCSIKKIDNNFFLINKSKILKKLQLFKKKNPYKITKINFNNLKGWITKSGKILSNKFCSFSIIGLSIKTNNREIISWDQPIVKDNNNGFIGLLTKNFFFTPHYLLRITQEVGYNFPVLSTTINNKSNFIMNRYDKIFDTYFKDNNNIIFDKVLSDEGGRFFHNQNRYVVINLMHKKPPLINDDYIWVSHNQIVDLIKNKVITIELRNLFACLNILKIK